MEAPYLDGIVIIKCNIWLYCIFVCHNAKACLVRLIYFSVKKIKRCLVEGNQSSLNFTWTFPKMHYWTDFMQELLRTINVEYYYEILTCFETFGFDYLRGKAATGGVLWEKMFLEILEHGMFGPCSFGKSINFRP